MSDLHPTVGHDTDRDMSTLPKRSTVVIVGGGFAGVATAHALSELGINDVTLVEREEICGYHASGRNAALCRQLVEDQAYSEHTVRGAAFLANPPVGFHTGPILTQTGSILLADTDDAIAALCNRSRTLGIAYETMQIRDVLHQWPRLTGVQAAGGVYFPHDGIIDIHALLRGYARAARQAGHTFVFQCEVRGFSPHSNGDVCVETSIGNIDARCIVVAGGAWANQLAQRAGSQVSGFSVLQRHLFITEWVNEVDRSAPFVWHTGNDNFYVRPEQNAYLLCGCDNTPVQPHDAKVAEGATTRLNEKLSAVAPGLAQMHIARSWAGLRTFSADKKPMVDWDPDLGWLFWVTGLGGHGVTASHAIGEDAAQRIASRVR